MHALLNEIGCPGCPGWPGRLDPVRQCMWRQSCTRGTGASPRPCVAEDSSYFAFCMSCITSARCVIPRTFRTYSCSTMIYLSEAAHPKPSAQGLSHFPKRPAPFFMTLLSPTALPHLCGHGCLPVRQPLSLHPRVAARWRRRRPPAPERPPAGPGGGLRRRRRGGRRCGAAERGRRGGRCRLEASFGARWRQWSE